MDHSRRMSATSDIYHIAVRGVGRQIIFEDDLDRQSYIQWLVEAVHKSNGLLLCWCLMGNHAHLLVKLPMSDLATTMQTVNSRYARYFNKRHDRIGHLLQDRFGSKPIESEAQLLAVVRYIHRNPDEAGISCFADYPWSSYREYLDNPVTVDADYILAFFGSKKEFVAFHNSWNPAHAELNTTVRHMSDEALIAFAMDTVDGKPLSDLKTLPKEERDEQLRKLRDAGLTIKQIERLTSIGRGIISRV